MADVEKLKAVAAGGLTAGKEYEMAQKGVGDIKQQALTAASQRSDSLMAPAAFRQQQQEMIATPLAAQEKSLGTLQGAGSAYSGAMAGAQSNFMSSINTSKGLYDQKLKKTADSDYRDAYIKLAEEKERKAAKEEATLEKLKKKNDQQNEDFNKSRKEFARQDAAADDTLTASDYKVLDDILSKANDIDTAKRLYELYDTSKLNEDINEDAIRTYLLQALDPEGLLDQASEENNSPIAPGMLDLQ